MALDPNITNSSLFNLRSLLLEIYSIVKTTKDRGNHDVVLGGLKSDENTFILVNYECVKLYRTIE